ncbi:serine/arginine repetitive matrix protein 2 [uncultured Streptomyces sp.]|uniref:serine/arginine repetitive matrix protein 2 n=1 Tax=uncultured Streptomyces sp. TaxID=174707 RepID=UPI002603E897|nr:serine/arginine repetitive matrix protein 2 [uncultured Streptomyces sp.]
MRRGAPARWNDETQSWETPDDRAPAGPLPPVPTSRPVVPPHPPQPTAPGAAGDTGGLQGVPEQPPRGDGEGARPHGPSGAPAYHSYTAPEVSGAHPYGPDTTPDGIVGTPHGPSGEQAPWTRRLTPVTAALAVAVLATGAAGLWFALGSPDDGGRAGGPGSSASAPLDEGVPEEPTDEEAEGLPTDGADTGSPSESTGPPPGYSTADDVEGFSVDVPDDWHDRTEDEHGVYYESSDGTELLQIFRIVEPMTALDAVAAASESRRSTPGFEEIAVGPYATQDGTDAAELVYAYDSAETGGRRQVVDRVFTASDGRLYALLVAGPDTGWPRQREVLDVAMAGFDPYASPF